MIPFPKDLAEEITVTRNFFRYFYASLKKERRFLSCAIALPWI